MLARSDYMPGGEVPVSVTAATETALAGPIRRERRNSDNYFILELSVQTMLNTKGRGVGFRVRFAGNEPAWPVSAPDRYEAYRVKTALNKCIADLRRKAATFYPVEGNAASGGPTSPFAEEPEGQAQKAPAEQPQSDRPQREKLAPSSNEWRFAKEEEEGTVLCVAETEQSEIKVGFIGQPGAAMSGFVSGVFDKDTRAVWTVDGRTTASSSGSLDEYFEWYAFNDLPDSLLDDVSNGEELRIAEFGGKGASVRLSGAGAAISAFKRCMSNE